MVKILLTGCPEQTMSAWVPNIVAYKYLSSVGQLDETTKNSLTKNVQLGYEKIVKKSQIGTQGDGWSQSYWNSYTGMESGQFKLMDNHHTVVRGDAVWNSAYFSKLLSIAKTTASIDDKYIVRLLNFVKTRQQSDGSFHDQVHISYYCSHTTGNRVPITAFVVSAFLEHSDSSPYKSDIDLGIQYLNQTVPTMKDSFHKAITAYAISLHVSKYKSKLAENEKLLLKMLDDLVLVADSSDRSKMYWPQSSAAVQVETAAYVLLAMIKSGNTKYMEPILKIMNWLLSRKNSYGGYTSTHDTGKRLLFKVEINKLVYYISCSSFQSLQSKLWVKFRIFS